ncbi:histone-lysine N-methyltransferase SETD5-like [Centropristis striata]|uniref:histone-lysine N-methyltransferase SETD5-like n=1 Tax=Centropristis striata TaxID=184440 RepID=UPI0027E1F6AC|nr:histone-lysine N-methyltransferase SETD5-like [Centropristis striata]
MQRRRRINPTDDAKFYASAGRDKVGLDIRYISAFKGRGIFTSTPFEKGDFLLEYRGELISRQECESRQRLYHDSLKVFMFEFRFNGKLWCVDAAKEDGSLGRLVNDDHLNPNAKMKYLTVEGKPHLCLFATRDISPGEEITYNYGESDWPWRCKTLKETSMEGHQDEVSISEPTTGAQKASTSRRRKKASMAASTGQLVKSFDQNPDEEIPQENSETTILTPLTEDFEEPLAESSRIQIGEDQIQTSPGPGPLSGHGKNPNEEIPQENSETTILASSSEDFEELMAESSRIQIVEDQIQTSPGPGPLSGHGKNPDEEIPQENSETTILTPLTEDFEEPLAESSRIQIGEDQIQTSPGPGPLSGHGKSPDFDMIYMDNGM